MTANGNSNGFNLEAALDLNKRTYKTGEGYTFTLRRVRALVCERIVSDNSSKPAIPIITVKIGAKGTREEENPGDPVYLAKLRVWEQEKNFRLAKYLFTEGIKGDPDDKFVKRMKVHFPDADETAMKYLWVVDHLPDDEIDTLMEAIMGQSEVTQKGLEQAADSFQSEGERQPDPGIPLST